MASADSGRLLGARVSCDIPTSSFSLGACPGVELFGRIALIPTVTLDASVGYRVESYWSGSPSATNWRLTQYPLLLGISYSPALGASVRPFVSAGLLLAPYELSYTTAARLRHTASDSTTSLSFGVFGGIGLRAILWRSIRLEAEARYVLNPIDAGDYVHPSENYPVALLGLGHAF